MESNFYGSHSMLLNTWITLLLWQANGTIVPNFSTWLFGDLLSVEKNETRK